MKDFLYLRCPHVDGLLSEVCQFGTYNSNTGPLLPFCQGNIHFLCLSVPSSLFPEVVIQSKEKYNLGIFYPSVSEGDMIVCLWLCLLLSGHDVRICSAMNSLAG